MIILVLLIYWFLLICLHFWREYNIWVFLSISVVVHGTKIVMKVFTLLNFLLFWLLNVWWFFWLFCVRLCICYTFSTFFSLFVLFFKMGLVFDYFFRRETGFIVGYWQWLVNLLNVWWFILILICNARFLKFLSFALDRSCLHSLNVADSFCFRSFWGRFDDFHSIFRRRLLTFNFVDLRFVHLVLFCLWSWIYFNNFFGNDHIWRFTLCGVIFWVSVSKW